MKAQGQYDIKSIAITGCNRGIGLAMLKYVVNNSDSDVKIFAMSRRTSEGQDELCKRDNVHYVNIDVTDKATVEAAADKVKSVVGDAGLNLLVNNAGVASSNVFAKSLETSAEEMQRMFNINAVSTHMVITAFYPLLKQSATVANKHLPICSARGAIVNFSSIVASIGMAPPLGTSLVFGYAVAKCAVNMMTKMYASEFKDDGIACVAVHPGWVKSDMGALGGDMGSGDITTDESGEHMINIAQNITEELSGYYLKKDCEKLPF